ncbi:hypothetical protein [Sulfurirhabdus autotrophica]|uniref:Putative secreted protein n=1 Tax=Sulfurirhabdus autotrophica TaxID=1706046 RepID=A0A4R3XQ03_9PROT|nr:hypothetical protein [Sulfurirhabdus autotrophica]TCV78079.1 putative secreted protein [Sulfurirhabdus autotrophica]
MKTTTMLLAATLSVGLLVSSGIANATSITSHFGTTSYDIINFSVSSPGVVEIQYAGGYYNPTFSLFDGSGAHLISSYPSDYLTQSLGTGNYSLLVGVCCDSIDYATNNFIDEPLMLSQTDGYNTGNYWIGGSGTLSGMQAFLDASSYYWLAQGEAYSLNISNNAQISSVPAPAAAWLLGSGLLGLIGVSRRKAA